MVIALTSMAGIALVTRTVSVETYGTYATAVSYGALLGTFTDLGGSYVVVREGVAAEARSRVIWNYLQTRLLLTVLTLAAGAAFVPLAFERDAWGTAFLALGVLVLSGPTVISPLGQLRGSMTGYRRSVLLQALATLSATVVVLFVLDAQSSIALVGAVLVGGLLASAYSLHWARREIEFPERGISWLEIGRTLKAIALLGLAAVLVSIYYRIDAILLLRLSGPEEAGYYGAAYRLFDQARTLPTAVLIPLAPMLARQLADHKRVLGDLDRRFRELGVTGGLGLALVTIGASYPVVLVTMGSRYERSITLAMLLGVSLAWSIVAYTAGYKAISARLEGRYVLIAAFGVVLNVGLNLVLIPPFDAEGAAVATLVTELATVMAYLSITRPFSEPGYRRRVVGVAIAGAAAAALGLSLLSAPAVYSWLASAVLIAAGGAFLIRAYRVLQALPRT